MTLVTVECLGCGRLRAAGWSLEHGVETGRCTCCGYVGWAFSEDLTEDERRELRDCPVELRGFEATRRHLVYR